MRILHGFFCPSSSISFCHKDFDGSSLLTKRDFTKDANELSNFPYFMDLQGVALAVLIYGVRTHGVDPYLLCDIPPS